MAGEPRWRRTLSAVSHGRYREGARPASSLCTVPQGAEVTHAVTRTADDADEPVLADDRHDDLRDEPHDDLDDDRAADGITHPLRYRTFGAILTVFGLIGLAASGGLSIERYLVLVNPAHKPSCSFSVFLTCTAAMDSWQGKLLGFPNPFIGLVAFTVVVTLGVVVLTGARLPAWLWRTLLAFTTVGLGLVAFLVWTSLYRLGKLCPYCMVVWAAMLPLWWYQVVHAVQERYVPASEKARAFVVRNRSVVLTALYVALLVWIVVVLHEPIAASF